MQNYFNCRQWDTGRNAKMKKPGIFCLVLAVEVGIRV
jgi:hypothetical protein